MHPQDPDPTHHVSRADSAALRRIERKLDLLLTSVKRLAIMSENIDTEIQTETTQEAALAAAIAANTTTLQTVQKQLADALDAAKNAGATPDQLAAFDAIHVKVSADLAALTAADQPAV